MDQRNVTFADLPDALVRDLLATATPVAEDVRARVDALRRSRETYRRNAHARDLIRRKADLDIPREPSVAGIDGSYQIHRLMSLDLCASAAVGVEGTSKEAIRHWPEPHHRMWVSAVPHNDSTTGVLRGLMVGMELELAREAPHDAVLLDGSFASLIIYLNQGLADGANAPPVLAEELRQRWEQQGIFQRLLGLLRSERVVAVPKFTSRNELASSGVGPGEIDGRTLATLILEPGEYTFPLPVYTGPPGGSPEEYHLPPHSASVDNQREMNNALQAVRAVYFRPFGWVPALRLEIPGTITNSANRLSVVLEGITRQFFTPAVIEPYPLFLADRMVKSLGAGVTVVEQTVAQHVADAGVDIELTMLFLQNYRTEGGRGGV